MATLRYDDKLHVHAPDGVVGAVETTPEYVALAERYGDALRAVHVHLNNAESPYAFRRGAALLLSETAPLSADFLRSSLSGQIAAARVLGAVADGVTLDRAYFESRLGALQALPEQHSHPARLRTLDRAGADTRAWRAVLGAKSYAGVYACERADGEGDDFYVVASLNQTPIGVDLANYARERADAGVTVGDFVRDPVYRNGRRLSARNAARVLAATASLLGVRIRDVADASAVDDDVAAPSRLAEPDCASEFDVIDERDENAVARGVAIYDGCVDMARARGGLVFAQSPVDGLLLLPSARRGGVVGVGRNAALDSFPIGMGRRERTGAPLAERAAARYTYDGKSEGRANDALLMRAYRAYDKARYKPLLRALCDVKARRLTPLAVRVSARAPAGV